ncbi:MAG: oxygen-independent coproporphyrinogen III oxidase [Candidatus Acidiferrum sp.]
MNPSLREMRDALSVGEEFVNRYNKPGPRYTSYPTAPVWTDSFGPKDFEEALAAAEEKRSPVSLYMHLPFCESLCLFCACNVVIQKDKRVAPPYLDILKKETDRISHSVSRERQVVQFHWGGGTPTYLSPEQIEDLFTYTRERFTFAPDAEIGIEVDPRVTTRAHLETVRKMGFNRLSMGIQDFKPEVQKAVHRIQPYEQTRDLIANARALGFDSINVDLIYGLPYQTAESFAHTVGQIVGLSPDRIAMFSYAHVPWLKKQQGSFVAHLPEGMKKFEIFRSGLLRSATARCTAIFKATPRRPAPIFTAWASQRSAGFRIATRKTSATSRRGKRPCTSAASPPCAATGCRRTIFCAAR